MDGRTLDLSRLRAELTALKEPDREWTEDQLIMWLRDWQRQGEGTISQRLRDLRRMADPEKSKVPVILHGTRYELVDSFYNFMKYRETVEGKASTAIRNDFKAVMVLGSFRGVPRNVWPKPPTIAQRVRRVMPTPEEIHALLHSKYASDPRHSYEQALVKYALVLDFGFGIRFPSEAWKLRVEDFDPKAHTLVVTEPKKGLRTRRVYIEPEWLCCGRTRASLAQYLKWRRKVAQPGETAFFLRPDGTAFPTKFAFGKYVRERVQAVFPQFRGYDGRRWNANARLIEWDWDYPRVADWLGHENVNTLRRDYENESRLYAKRYGQHWLDRAFKGRQRTKETA